MTDFLSWGSSTGDIFVIFFLGYGVRVGEVVVFSFSLTRTEMLIHFWYQSHQITKLKYLSSCPVVVSAQSIEFMC